MKLEPESKIALAYKYMVSKHGLQKRKDGDDYIEHPKRTAVSVMMYKSGSYRIEELLIIALLHDIIEDTNGTYEEIQDLFGDIVADTVQELTSVSKEAMAKEGETKKSYLAKKMTDMSEYALVIKLCDRLDNIQSLHQLDEGDGKFKYRQLKDTEFILDYLYRKRTFLTRTHHILLKEIQRAMDSYKPIDPMKTTKDVG